MRGLDRYPVTGIACRWNGLEHAVVNLSVGGFFVASDHIPEQGQAIGLDLLLPGREAMPLEATVAWVNVAGAPRVIDLPSGFGVRILKMGFRERLAILAVLSPRDPRSARRPR